MRLKQMMATCVAVACMLLSLPTSAYTQKIGNSIWSFGINEDEDGKVTASVTGYRQVDEKGDRVMPTAGFALTVPDSLTAEWTNEFVKVSERVYDEYGNFLSNKYATVRGPEIKSVTVPVTSVNVNIYDYEYHYDSELGYGYYTYHNYLDNLTSLSLPATVEYVSGFEDCTNLTTVSMSADARWSGSTFYDSPYRKNLGEFIVLGDTLVAYQGEAASVTVPDGVKIIGEGAFCTEYGNASTGLTSVTLPASVKMINWYAFEGCENLKEINLPDGLTYIGGSAFENCEALTAIAIPSKVKIIGSYAFAGSNIGTVSIPEGVTSLDGTFSYCTNLSSVTLPSSLERIYGVFCGCSSLASVTLPSGLEYVGNSTFEDCDSLASIALPDSVEGLGSYAFGWCTNLSSVKLSAELKYINSSAFYGCSALASIALPDSLEYVYDYAFGYCSKLATVTGGTGVTYVGDDAFGYTAIEDNLPSNSIFQVGTLVLGCKGTFAGKLSIPAGVTYIRQGAFAAYFSYGTDYERDTYDITELELPSSVHTIGWSAFAGTEISKVTGGAGLTSAESAFDSTPYGSTFWNQRGSADVPFELVRLGGVVFGYKGVCPATVTIPDDVVELQGGLFDSDNDGSVTNITSAVVGAKLEYLPNWTFGGNENLANVTFRGPLAGIGSYAFYGCQALTAFEIPATVEYIDDGAFNYCTNLASVTGGGAIDCVYCPFYGCPSLTDVSFTGPLSDITGDDLFGGTTTNIVNVTFNQTEVVYEDEDPYFEDINFPTWMFDSLDKLESVKFTRKGYKLVEWEARANGPFEETFADETETFKLKYKYWYSNGAGNLDWYVDSLWLSPTWKRVLADPDTDGPFNSAEKSVYIGWLTDDSGNIVGSVTVTAAKGKNGVSNTKVVVQLLGEKKVTLKGTVDANGNGNGDLAGIKLGANGLTGTLKVNGAVYTADGARDVNKTKKDAGQSALKALKDKVWTVVLGPRAGDSAFANGYLGFSVTMGNKGKAKVKGVLPSGAKVSANGQTIVGETGFCVPVVCSKKDSVGFLLWLDLDGNAIDVTSVSDWKSTSNKDATFTVPVEVETFDALAPLSGTVPFIVSPDDVPAALTGVLADFLPVEEPIKANGGKWELAKPAVVKYKKGAFDQAAYDKGVAQGKTNAGSLKLRYTQKDGSFKGSFKLYQLQGDKLKKHSVNVNGVVAGGVGYGSALIKKIGSMPVEIGDVD